MAGTRTGGLKASATNKARYGEQFYQQIGGLNVKSWVANGRKPRGFAAVPGLASRAGKIGGTISKRGASRPKPELIEVERFFIEDETINDHIIEAFQPTPWYKGWIRFNKEK